MEPVSYLVIITALALIALGAYGALPSLFLRDTGSEGAGGSLFLPGPDGSEEAKSARQYVSARPAAATSDRSGPEEEAPPGYEVEDLEPDGYLAPRPVVADIPAPEELSGERSKDTREETRTVEPLAQRLSREVAELQMQVEELRSELRAVIQSSARRETSTPSQGHIRKTPRQSEVSPTGRDSRQRRLAAG
jgi:hypothetical protein